MCSVQLVNFMTQTFFYINYLCSNDADILSKEIKQFLKKKNVTALFLITHQYKIDREKQSLLQSDILHTLVVLDPL